MGAGRSEWVQRRSAPIVATMAMLVAVMALSVFGHALFGIGRHAGLVAPGDLWGLADSSSAILHGHFTDVYARTGALTSPPALEVVLAPLVGLAQILGLAPHLHRGSEPPALWLVLGPAAVLLASSALFAVDAVARMWRMTEWWRRALALVGAFGVANVAGGWGHPEDCIALAMVVWAALTMERFGALGARRAALLLGLGVAFQPLALIGVAPVLARLRWREVVHLVPRLVLPSIVLVALPLVARPNVTLFVLVRQPFQPASVSLTPLTHLAPVIGAGLDGGGPTRLVAVVVSAALAVLVCHRHHDLATVLGLCAVGFFVRILLETEMNWYYLWPVPALCLLLALRRGPARFWLCAAALGASIVLGDRRVHEIVVWWPVLMATVALMLACAAPPSRRWLVAARQFRAVRAVRAVRPVEFGSMVEPAGAESSRE